jgi:hypothetical protein
VTPAGGTFRMHLGHKTFTLTHYDANTFTFPLETSVAAVTFAIGSAGR